MPKHWYSYRDCCNDKESELCVQSKPYFMIYRYSELQAEYKKYITKVNTKSIKTFSANIEELKQKTELTEEEAEFLKYYYKLMPVSLAPSTMNRICWHIENSMNEHYDKLKSETMDYSKYRYKHIKKSKDITERVHDIYHSYVLAKTNKSGVDATIATKNYCTQALKSLGKDKHVLNDIVDLIKTNKTAKSFLWDCATEMMLDRLENLYDCNE